MPILENPLIVYKRNSSLEWSEIAKLTGISEQGLYSLCRKDVSEMKLVRIGTVIALRETLGIDLMEYIK